MNTPGVFGILALQVAAAVSVVVFFRGTPNAEGAWRTVVAPVLAAIAMVVALVLAVQNVELITLASASVNLVLMLTIPAVCLVGLIWALVLRRTRPDVYAGIAADCEKDADR